jgi:hypothetical protein
MLSPACTSAVSPSIVKVVNPPTVTGVTVVLFPATTLYSLALVSSRAIHKFSIASAIVNPGPVL